MRVGAWQEHHWVPLKENDSVPVDDTDTKVWTISQELVITIKQIRIVVAQDMG
jgi:hypothetical protein